MCGIASWLEVLPRPSEQMVAMMRLAKHRGPDDDGLLGLSRFGEAPVRWRESAPPPVDAVGIALGHRRLSIIDLSDAGQQPMGDPTGRYQVTYNGEIYNHPELREELKRLGHAFRTQTDTEVLLAAWKEWGENCLQRFNGMFAFVLLDMEKQCLFAVRDRFGIKPLYHYRSSTGGIVFASEIKQFSALEGWSPKLNGQRCYDYLAWGLTDHTEETCFQDVNQVPPGGIAMVRVKDSTSRPNVEIKQWYRLPMQTIDLSMQEATLETKRLLTDSVRLRLRSDVTVGSCLSGGIDSSSIVCLIDQLRGLDLPTKTFTARFPGDVVDEGAWCELVSGNTQTIPVSIYPEEKNIPSRLPELVWIQDEPFGSTSIFAQSEVFAMAGNEGVTVMLDGQGADEQFAGYETFIKCHLRHLLKSGNKSAFEAELSATAAWRNRSPDDLRKSLQVADGDRAKPDWLDLEKLGARPNHLFESLDSLDSPIETLARSMVEKRNLQMLLHWEDRNSMARSIEARVPFLDHRLVEHVLSTPGEQRLKEGRTKILLREAMRKIVPEPILERKDKLGFATPEERWIREGRPDEYQLLVDQAIQASNGILKPAQTRKETQAMLKGDKPFTFQLWRLACFGAWLDRFGISR